MITIFWGLGRIGKGMLELCKRFHIRPDFITDNNTELWGKTYGGISVISPEEMLDKTASPTVFITCSNTSEIMVQLHEMGISEAYDAKGFHVLLNRVPEWFECVRRQLSIKWLETEEASNNICFMLENGLTLGGVEAWSVQTGSALREQGHKVYYCVPREEKRYINSVDDDEIIYVDGSYPYERLWNVLMILSKRRMNTIICNFPGYCFEATNIIKKLTGNSVNVIAIIHNDEAAYYRAYNDCEKRIDYCLTISQQMNNRMVQLGFPREKLRHLPWKIDCEEDLSRSYSQEDEPLRIGYAGRITKKQKRVDLLLEIAELLYGKDVPFELFIAGDGDYLEELKTRFRGTPYKEKIHILGSLERSLMPVFWKEKDIYIGCSEWEGRSIVKDEAMAGGAVPIVTNTSGAEDDIVSGENGFVVPVGDIDAIVEKIKFLSSNREKLEAMGEKAHEAIVWINHNYHFKEYWENLLG